MTPGGYATLLDKLIRFVHVAMVLEGGYGLDPLADFVSACVKVLLGDRSDINSQITSLPFDTTVNMVTETCQTHKPFWKAFKKDIPEEITSRSIPFTRDVEGGRKV
ncbi:hypothetical protein SEVIR_2G376350v4 [Setaria viridis]